jgi:hypothetical protein
MKEMYYVPLPCFDESQSDKWQFVKTKLNPNQLYSSFNQVPLYNISSNSYVLLLCDDSDYEPLLTNDLHERFLNTTIPKMMKWVLQMPKLFTETSVPLLLRNVPYSFSLNQLQVRCLLSAAFFNLLPTPKEFAYNILPSELFRRCVFQDIVNFNEMFTNEYDRAKQRCIIEYFMVMEQRSNSEQSEEKMRNHLIIFERKVLNDEQKNKDYYLNNNSPLSELVVQVNTKIEDQPNTLKVNFANRMIGGGVLYGLTAQEEILFVEYPEQIIQLLFCDEMRDHETLYIRGCEQFSSIKGYRFRISFEGSPKSNTVDYSNEEIVAMDASEFQKLGTRKQYKGNF